MRADIPLRFVVSCGTFVICTQEGIGKRVLSIREILKKHPIELTTAGICGFVCLVFLLPAILSEFLGRSGYEGSGSANVVVYHKMSKRPIFGGATRRDAVEKRIASIREMLRYEAGFATEDVSWEEVNAYFEGLEERSREQFKEQRTLYCSMESADLRDTDLSGLDFRGLSLRACDLSECKFDGARLEGSLLLDADFDESSFQNMDLRTVDINPGQVKSADFSGAILEGKRFGFGMNCIYRNANLRNVTIEHRTAMGMNVRGADLTGARIDIPWRSPDDDNGRDPYSSIEFDEATKVDGLYLGDVHDKEAAFVKFALLRGAIASFPRQNQITREWELRNYLTGAVICSGPGPREAFQAELARIRAELSSLAGGANSVTRDVLTELAPSARDSAIALQSRFEGVNLEGVDLSALDLSELSLEGARMRNTRLNGANLFNTSLQGAYLETTDCSLAEGGGLVLDGAEIRNSTFSKASLQGAVVHRARIRNTGFGSANLRAATLRLWQCEHMDFSAADLSGGLIEFWLNGESPNWDTQRFYRTVIYDDKTRVEGLRLSGVADPEIPFVKWALAHGAVLVESTPAPQETPPS